MIEPDAPYALGTSEEQERRASLLTEPHIQPLVCYLEKVREEAGQDYDLPSFDPLDGGINARALLLLEAPGPKAVGSTFISRNNPDPTARNLCELLAGARIPRQDTLIWNIVPWYVGDSQGRIRPVNKSDINRAVPYLSSLLGLLVNLKVIILVGKKAQSAASEISHLTNMPIIHMHHPSARVFNVWPEKRAESGKSLEHVARLLGLAKEG